MARINIEDQFWVDVGAVAAALGDYAKAVGLTLLFIKLAQEKHKKGQSISESEFAEKFHESLIPNFAKRTPSGIQAVGANKHFAWLEQKIEAGRAGGKKSAKNRPRDAEGRLLQIKNTPSDHQPSPSPSFSSSSSGSSKERALAQKSGEPMPEMKFAIATYRDLLDSIPIMTREKWNHQYPDSAWLGEQLSLAWDYHSAEPTERPRTAGQWMKKLHSWLANGWKKHAEAKSGPLNGQSWEDQANRILAGVRRYGPNESDSLRQYLGDDVFGLAVRVAGGLSAVRMLPNTDFTAKRLAGMLKETCQKLGQLPNPPEAS